MHIVSHSMTTRIKASIKGVPRFLSIQTECLAILLHHLSSEGPKPPMPSCIRIPDRMGEGKTAGMTYLLQFVAEFEESLNVARKLVETGLLHPAFSDVHAVADRTQR